MAFPEPFCRRMEAMLGEEYPAFIEALSEPESVHALRANPAKLSTEALLAIAPALRRIPYTADGFFCTGDGWGAHALHRAGGFYLQDPAAMAPVAAAPIQKGDRVLDLCASPGGKTAQLSAAVGDGGLVVSNEMNPGRARTLGGNVERLGLRNVIVMNADGAYTAGLFPAFFDLVVCDAPCSGEGMFRKNPEAAVVWNEGAVANCAAMQKTLLDAAAAAVRPGGHLLYSTCTFSLEEDERQVAQFLAAHPAFTLCDVPEAIRDASRPGCALPDFPAVPLDKTRRFYPHVSPGEGQFLALMQNTADGCAEAPAFRDASLPLNKANAEIASTFLRDTLETEPNCAIQSLGDRIVLLPDGVIVPPHCVLSAGVTLGEVQKGRLVPHHQFCSAFGKDFRRRVDLPGGPLPRLGSEADDRQLTAYLHGETLDVPDTPDGWAAVTVSGAALGGGKVTGGTLKNHYPKGLRI